MTPAGRSKTGLLAALALAAGACGADTREEISETRKLPAPRPEQTVAADARMRFGGMGASPHGVPAPHATPALAWDVPAGWQQVAAKPMQTASFAVAGRDGLDASITSLPGTSGGLAANLNRWRRQMAMPDLSDAEVAALPRVKVLGADAAYVEIDGAFKGAAVSTMAGVALVRPTTSVFVRLVGPAADVRAELPKFRALAASLRETDAPAGGDEAEVPEGPDPSAIRWSAPDGWTQGPAKQMRLVTFNPKNAPGVECYVTLLGGAAGGLAANVDRWRDQFGQAPLDAAAIAALPAVPVLGRDAHVVDVDAGERALTGLVCELGTQTLFVKMTGPAAAVHAERERFLAFCRSLAQP